MRAKTLRLNATTGTIAAENGASPYMLMAMFEEHSVCDVSGHRALAWNENTKRTLKSY